MKATLILKPGKLEFSEVKTPKPSKGELLVKVKAALTCGTDLKAYRQGHHVIPMPGLFGHEFSGIVAEAGRGVKSFKKGDEIMAVHSAPCLKCIYCKKKLYNLCENIMDTKVLGAFAEYVLLPSHIVKQNVFHKPKNLSFEQAVFLEPLSCVVHGMYGKYIRKNDTALVLGAGPIGLLHLILLKDKGVNVIVAGLEKERLNLAKKLGAKLAVMPDKLQAAVKKITKGLGVDYVFECTGQPDVWQSSVEHLRRGGTAVMFGGCKSGTTVTYDTGRLHYDEITIKGVFHFTPSDVKEAYKILKMGKMPIKKLISGRYPLKHTEKAFKNLSEGRGIKYLIIP
ncbi:MAG: zinc-binding dehydrogenase [Nitrospiraceae bacterium]|nr:zinc-binding dehydrogenase [Nitrospiraceae bacterium]